MPKTVLVTGSSRGIGLACALRFCAASRENAEYNVVFNCIRSINSLNETVATLRADGISAHAIQADVSDYSEVTAMLDQIKSIYSGIDILINNAGIEYFGLFQDSNPIEWEHCIRTNLLSMMNCTHAVLPDMLSNRSGSIINISSIWGNAGASCEAVYAATKAGVNGFTKSMAQELGPTGIRVNAIACGAVNTDMNSRLTPDERYAFTQNIPLMRFANTSEIADVAFFLASDASSYITGQVIGVDGGIGV